jgi:hypothetical protein
MARNRQKDNSMLLLAVIVVGVLVALALFWFESGRPQIGSEESPSPSVTITVKSSTDNQTANLRRLGNPDPKLTPGAINPDVTQANIARTICKSGWTATIRPSSSYTTTLKKKQIVQYGYSDTRTASYEEDHLISLELGGAPRDEANLWPEPYVLSDNGKDVGARAKDRYENWLNAQVCSGKMKLLDAQQAIANDWVGHWLSVAPSVSSSGIISNSDD